MREIFLCNPDYKTTKTPETSLERITCKSEGTIKTQFWKEKSRLGSWGIVSSYLLYLANLNEEMFLLFLPFQVWEIVGGRSEGMPANRAANWRSSRSSIHFSCLGTSNTTQPDRGERRCESGDASYWGYTRHVWVGAAVQVWLLHPQMTLELI